MLVKSSDEMHTMVEDLSGLSMDIDDSLSNWFSGLIFLNELVSLLLRGPTWVLSYQTFQ